MRQIAIQTACLICTRLIHDNLWLNPLNANSLKLGTVGKFHIELSGKALPPVYMQRNEPAASALPLTFTNSAWSAHSDMQLNIIEASFSAYRLMVVFA